MDRRVKPGDDGGVRGDDTVCVDAVLQLSVESLELSATIPNERTLQFALLLCHLSDPVLTPCLAQLRASSRGVWLMEPGVAPAARVSQTPPRDASGHRPLYYEGCLHWLDGSGLKR